MPTPIMTQINDFMRSELYLTLAPSSQGVYKSILTAFAQWAITELDMDRNARFAYFADPEKIARYCQYLSEQGKTGVSIKNNLVVIKMAARYFKVNIKYTYRIPSAEKKAHLLKKMDRMFSDEDVQNILSFKFDDEPIGLERMRKRAMVQFLIESGARVKEVSVIKKKHVRLDKRFAFIKDSKTVPRPAFFSPDCMEKIKIIMQSIDDNDIIFYNASKCKKIFTKMLEDLGMKSDCDGRGPHTARHYAATSMYYHGKISLEDIAIILGDTPETIRKTYLHPTPEMLGGIIDNAMGWVS